MQEAQHQTSHPGPSSDRGTHTEQERQRRQHADRKPLLKVKQQVSTRHSVARTVQQKVFNSLLAVTANERTQRVRMKQRAHSMHELVETGPVTKPHQKAISMAVN